VVCHQAVSVQRAAGLCRQIPQVREVDEVVGVVPKAIPAIVPALHDVHGNMRHDEPRPPWHKGTTADGTRG